MADNTIKGAKQCMITRGQDGKAQLNSCIDAEYWSDNKLSDTSNTMGYTKEVTYAEKMDFERVCQRVGIAFEEGEDKCMTESVNKIETQDTVPEKETVKGVTGYKFEQPSKIKEIEEVHDIVLQPYNERNKGGQ